MNSLRNKEKVVEKLYCNVCRKSFSSQKTLDQHLKSKLHEKKMAEAQEKQEKAKQEELEKASQPVELREEDGNDKEENTMGSGEFTPEEYEFIPEKCLFCRQISDTMEECLYFHSVTHSNITHMFQKHGMIIPDRHCVIDLEGLLDYLGQKVALSLSLSLSTVDLCGLHLPDLQPWLQKPHRGSGTYVGQRPHFHRVQHRTIHALLAF